MIPDSDSDRSRTLIPIQAGHRFQSIPDRVVIDVVMESGDGFGVKHQRLGGPFS